MSHDLSTTHEYRLPMRHNNSCYYPLWMMTTNASSPQVCREMWMIFLFLVVLSVRFGISEPRCRSLQTVISAFLECYLSQCWPHCCFPDIATSREETWGPVGKARRAIPCCTRNVPWLPVRGEREKPIRKQWVCWAMIFKPPEETGDRPNRFQRTAWHVTWSLQKGVGDQPRG